LLDESAFRIFNIFFFLAERWSLAEPAPPKAVKKQQAHSDANCAIARRRKKAALFLFRLTVVSLEIFWILFYQVVTMTELSFTKTFLQEVDSKPIKLPYDYVVPPEDMRLPVPVSYCTRACENDRSFNYNFSLFHSECLHVNAM
jgi:hypothetical protein